MQIDALFRHWIFEVESYLKNVAEIMMFFIRIAETTHRHEN